LKKNFTKIKYNFHKSPALARAAALRCALVSAGPRQRCRADTSQNPALTSARASAAALTFFREPARGTRAAALPR